ncbi:hypothetical protein Vretimale_2524 [Volvox reticuliferus]|uniref:Uncharacterized protein n=1 Tax=Volvox reticuliferus TaxID=1737510 RepID=A0A8J4C3Q7_9CHLO|nr:hypothetical protein Vretifemale_4732 [Volvox reticuliferus]GIL96717.1 hypothetical protein Vretimale_2524 [Volvox reticuliferus]
MKMLFILFFASLVAGNVDITHQKNYYWSEQGLENPSQGLLQVADWSLLYFNTSREIRPVLLFTIATPASIPVVLPQVLENLASFLSQDQMDANGNRATTLAEHTLVASTNIEAHHGCGRLTEKYHHKCHEFDHKFNGAVYDHLELSQTKAHAYSIGLSRIKYLVDMVSLGYDVFYFDLHHYFFKNPLRYMYTHTTTPIVVSATPSSVCQPLSAAPDGSLPDEHHRLDIAFVRSTPSTFRCLYNWLYWSTHTMHEAEDKPLDHHTFRTVMQECVSSLGTSVLSVSYLNPEHFPSECNAKCGCRGGAPVERPPDGKCPTEVMSNWVGMIFSCSDSATSLGSLIDKYASMYRDAGLTLVV